MSIIFLTFPVYIFNRSPLLALQEASLWNRQSRETGSISRRVKVLDEDVQPDQIQRGSAHQEKSTLCKQYMSLSVSCTSKFPLVSLNGSFLSLRCSIHLPSRSKKTKRKNVWRGGSWMSCTKSSWTPTLSTTA